MRICIAMDIDPAYADAVHPMGVTEEGYDAICDRLGDMGSDITVTSDV